MATMPNDNHRYGVFNISGNPNLGISPQRDNHGCWPCRFRKKACEPHPHPLDGVCVDCSKFNIRCTGQGISRPSEPGLADKVRAVAKSWIADRTKRVPSVTPLDLSYLWSHLLSSAPAHVPTSPDDFNPHPHPHLVLDDASPIAPSLFSAPETTPLHFGLVSPQFSETYRAHTDSSHHHAAAVPLSSQKRIDVSMIDPRDITSSLHDQFPDYRKYLPPSGGMSSEDRDDYRNIHGPMDYASNVFSLPSQCSSDDVPSPFSGSYNAFGNPAKRHSHGQAQFVTPEQLSLANFTEMDVPWGHPQVHR